MELNDITYPANGFGLGTRRDPRPLGAKLRENALALAATLSAFAAVTLLASGLTLMLTNDARAATLPKTSATGQEPTGEAMAHTCAACHGTHGQVRGEAFVPLAGMNAEEFIRSMKDFRDLKRPSSIMSHIAEGYDDASIERMAEWFAKQKPAAKTAEQPAHPVNLSTKETPQ